MYKNRENYHPLDRLSQEVKAHAHFISEIDGLSEFIQNEVAPLKATVAELKEYIELMLEQIMWHSQVIGEPFPIWDHITGVSIPPSNNEEFRFIKLSYNDSYNSGLLTSQTSTTDDLGHILSTAVINYTKSPLHGRTVRLINTEKRFLRPNISGTLENDAIKDISFSMGSVQFATWSVADTISGPISLTRRGDTWAYGNGRAASYLVRFNPGLVTTLANETRVYSMGATYYLRIL